MKSTHVNFDRGLGDMLYQETEFYVVLLNNFNTFS